MSEHAFLACSSAGRWFHCAASPTLEHRYPQEETEQTREGNAAHWVVSSSLDSYLTDTVKTCQEFLNETAPNGVIITQEMIDAAGMYVTYVLSIVQERGALRALATEFKIVNNVVSDYNWGTPDNFIFSPELLDVFDFKYGHKFVEVYENKQLINYALLIMELYGVDGIQDQSLTVRFHLGQPRCYNGDQLIRTWSIKGSDLRNYRNQFRGAAAKAIPDDLNTVPEATTGMHCLDCNARAACKASQRMGYNVTDVAYKGNDHSMLSPDDVGLELTFLKQAKSKLDSRIEALEAVVEGYLRSGNAVNGWSMQETYGRQSWTIPHDELVALGDMLGIKLNKPAAVTPKQAIGLGVDESLINSVSECKKNGVKLKPENLNKVKRIFSNG